MMNMECIGGPYGGEQYQRSPDDKEGSRLPVLELQEDGSVETTYYELRADKKITAINGSKLLQWHYLGQR